MFEKIGQALRLLRKARGLQQKELAAAVGAHFATVSRWEAGETAPGLERLDQILEAMGVTPRELAAAIEQVEGIPAPAEEAPMLDLDDPEDTLLEEMLVRSARGDDTTQWLEEVEKAAQRLRRVRGLAERRAHPAPRPEPHEEPSSHDTPERPATDG